MGLLADLLLDIKHSHLSHDEGTLVASQIGKTNHKVGLTQNGGVAVLFCLPPIVGTSPPSTHLKNLKIDYYLKCEVQDPEGRVSTGKYSILECTSDNEEIQSMFLRIIEDHLDDIEETPNVKKLNKLINNLIDLFSELSTSGNEILGLWGELFVISQLEKPEIWVDNWHNDPNNIYDFLWASSAVEIKCSCSEDRTHHFSLFQLRPKADLNVRIVSILTKRSEFGLSILELVQKIENNLKSKELKNKLRQLVMKIGGKSITNHSNRYDASMASATINIYEAANIPAVVPEDPHIVKGINFRVELLGIPEKEITLEESYKV